MPAAPRQITPADLIPDAEYATQRGAPRRAAADQAPAPGRAGAGLHLIFESYDTMLFQVQEMLLTEKGGAETGPRRTRRLQSADPAGRELVATVMFEIDDEVRRAKALARLGGVEDTSSSRSGDERARASRRATWSAPARTARPPRSTSCAFRSPPTRSPASAIPATQWSAATIPATPISPCSAGDARRTGEGPGVVSLLPPSPEVGEQGRWRSGRAGRMAVEWRLVGGRLEVGWRSAGVRRAVRGCFRSAVKI